MIWAQVREGFFLFVFLFDPQRFIGVKRNSPFFFPIYIVMSVHARSSFALFSSVSIGKRLTFFLLYGRSYR